MNTNERLKAYHTELYDSMISALNYVLEGEEQLASLSEKSYYKLLDDIDKHVPMKYALKVKQTFDRMYPDCASQYIKTNLFTIEQTKRCYEKMRSAITKIIDSLYPLSSYEEVTTAPDGIIFPDKQQHDYYTEKRNGIGHHVFLGGETKDIINLSGDATFLTELVMKANKQIILNYDELFCFDAKITAPDIYLPEKHKVFISPECHLYGDIHYGMDSLTIGNIE